MSIITCPNCNVRVLQNEDGTCPSCKINLLKSQATINKRISEIEEMENIKLPMRIIVKNNETMNIERKWNAQYSKYFIVVLILSLFEILYKVVNINTANNSAIAYPLWYKPTIIIAELFRILLLITIWNRRRSGVYGIIVISIALTIMNYILFGNLWILVNLVVPVLIILIIRPYWGILK
jgi:hypothetical protein